MVNKFHAARINPILDAIFSHYNQLFKMKQSAGKIDIFSILYGCWMPPTTRHIMWIGGYHPSDVIELIMTHVELYGDQKNKMLQLKDTLLKDETDNTRELESLQKHISTSLSGNAFVDKGDEYVMTSFATHMSSADTVRQKSLTEMQRILKETQQVASVFTMNDYFKRFFTLNHLWESRQRNN
ncbi:transcription factor TGAL6-like [Rutidosis leptorrhynchoides]|uniref:transcription factor TGAL6-like n=1 Tax=Rutidosis leptorrhynchoides TaxID=125765 RepID=UPI003A9A43DB